MTPSPESIGPGIINYEAERKLPYVISEINTIVKKAVSAINTDGKILVIGMIADRENSATGEIKEYFHPVVFIKDPLSAAYDEADEDLVLGGNNFSNLYLMDRYEYTVDWGGKTGEHSYETLPSEEGHPFDLFFEGEQNHVYLQLFEVGDNFAKAGIPNHRESIQNGDVGEYLLPKTINAQIKLDVAHRILTGLKNASGISIPEVQL